MGTLIFLFIACSMISAVILSPLNQSGTGALVGLFLGPLGLLYSTIKRVQFNHDTSQKISLNEQKIRESEDRIQNLKIQLKDAEKETLSADLALSALEISKPNDDQSSEYLIFEDDEHEKRLQNRVKHTFKTRKEVLQFKMENENTGKEWENNEGFHCYLYED